MKTNRSTMKSLTSCLLLALAMIPNLKGADDPLNLTLRSRVKAQGGANETFAIMEKKAALDPKKTAIIICDMWDDHWCKSASRRVAELAGPMNEVVKAARAKGVFIIHAPSSVVNFYKDTPQRKRAQTAPFAKTPVAPASNSLPRVSASKLTTCQGGRAPSRSPIAV